MASHPSRIGSYRIEKLLASGRLGDVYAAWDEQLRRPVALRFLASGTARDPGLRARFRAAAQTAAGLDHAAIVRVHALVEHDDGDVLVMELVEGKSLARRRGAAGGIPLAVALAAEVAEGLAAAHARQVRHGDLRAGNVMITPAGHAKILDFGFSRQIGEDAPGGGDPGDVGERADLFALGVLLYEMLAGRSPGAGESPFTTLARRRGGRLTRLSKARADVPPVLSALVDRLLLAKPGHRPASAAAVARELRAIAGTLDSAGTAARAAGAPAMTGMPGRAASPSIIAGTPGRALPALRGLRAGRRWIGLGVGVAAALAAIGGTVGFLEARRESTLYVAVAPPAITRGASLPGVDLLAMGLRTALLHALEGVAGLYALPPEQVDVVPGPPIAMARAAAASEVITARLSCQQDSCEVTLSRVAGRDGSLLWTQSLETPAAEPYLLAAAAEGYVRKEYAARGRRAGAPSLAVTPHDFKAYLALRRDLMPEGRADGAGAEGGTGAADGTGGTLRLDAGLDRIAALRTGSPRFLEGALLQAELLRRRFGAGRDPADLGRALTVLAEARSLAPADPRPLYGEIAAASLGGRWDRAQAAIDALARLQPGEPEILVRRARLLDRRGQARQGLEPLREAVRLRPSWTNLTALAGLESRLGETAAARSHLLQAQALMPHPAAPPMPPVQLRR